MLTEQMRSDEVPGREEVKAKLAEDLASRLATFWDRAFTEFNVAKAMAITEGQAGPQSTSNSSAGLGALAAEVGWRQAMGTKEERGVRSPESLSYEALAHCLLVGLELGSEDDARCWEELHGILEGCSRVSAEVLQDDLSKPGSASLGSSPWPGESLYEAPSKPSTASSDARRASARLHFVAALAEWVNMHDLHKP